MSLSRHLPPWWTGGAVRQSVVMAVSVRRRLTASLTDLAVIGSWLGVLTVAGAVVRRSVPVRPPVALVGRALAAMDLGVLLATVLPAGAYLGSTEATAQATLGKRLQGLRVLDQYDAPPDATRIAVRTFVKLLPWQLGHVAVARIMLGVRQPWVGWPCYLASLTVPAVSVALALRDPAGRALHDRIAGTRVSAVEACAAKTSRGAQSSSS